MARQASVLRETTETRIEIAVDLDSGARGQAQTGHGFLDHLLDQLIRHGRLGVEVSGRGDLDVDVHHLAEDVGITLGQCVREALGDKGGIERYADAAVPMDETLAHVVLDISGRPYIAFDPAGFEGDCRGFTVHHLRELLRGFCNHAAVTLHVRVLTGRETHHVCECIVKAFARCLRAATRVEAGGGQPPTTKGVL